jgi:hypothetical protein
MPEPALREEVSRTKRLRPLLMPSSTSSADDAGSLKTFLRMSEKSWTRVAGSESPEEFRRASVALIHDTEWQATVLDAAQRMNWARAPIELLSTFATNDHVLALFPLPFDEALEPAARMTARRAFAWTAHVFVHIKNCVGSSSIEEPRAGHLLDYYDDWSITREVRQTLYRVDFTSAGVLALFGATVKGGMKQWMPRAAYSDFVSASRVWLDLMSTTFGIDVPAEIRDAVDWAAAERKHHEWRAAREQSARRFEEGGRVPRLVLPLPDSGRAK